MKSDVECLQCMMKQALNTARVATPSEAQQREIINRVSKLIPQADLADTPAGISTPLYKIVSEVTGNADPYLQHKIDSNREAMKFFEQLKQHVNDANDPLKTALLIAVAGNIIDLGIGHRFDIAEEVDKILHGKFKIDHSAEFLAELQPGKKMLYLGDNAGEIVFDRILIESLLETGIEITYSVKSGPIINDATMADAEMIGLTKIVNVIESGSADIGVNFDNACAEFLDYFKKADIILSKGHGNFETCNDVPGNKYFLLKAKCAIVASEIGVELGDLVMIHKNSVTFRKKTDTYSRTFRRT